MKIDHIAIWTQDLEKVKDFYCHYFNCLCSEKYVNPKKQFSSYFISFKGQTTRIELMHRPDIATIIQKHASSIGLTHLAISVGCQTEVNRLTEQLRYDGYSIIGEPRTTGDGYYESVVEDCEGNQIEITA